MAYMRLIYGLYEGYIRIWVGCLILKKLYTGEG